MSVVSAESSGSSFDSSTARLEQIDMAPINALFGEVAKPLGNAAKQQESSLNAAATTDMGVCH